MGKLKFILPLFFAFFLLAASSSFAHHRGKVLGVSTQSSDLVFPEVSAGPGAILPDSPFFVFDTIWQKVKLFSARSAEDKAKVRAQIAGERLAELRIMLSQNDPDGIAIALSQMEQEAQQSSTELSQAAASGQNVEEAAKELNEAIKLQRKVLGLLANQTDGQLRLQIKAAREALKLSKVEVEDELPEELLEDEIENELEDEIEEDADEVEDLTEELEDQIEELQEQASESAKKIDKKRVEAIKKAIEKKNEELKKENELLQKAEKQQAEFAKKQQKLLREKAKKAAEAAKELTEQISSENEEDSNSEPVSNSGSGSSGSGGSGSSGSSGSSGHDGGDDN
ncbi:MAG: DUF5667 domain-containing protein [Patescibacteria group bacterium]